MGIVQPKAWTPRGLFSVLLPQYFRRPRNGQEQLGAPSTHKVPLDANEYHEYITRKTKRLRESLHMMNTTNVPTNGYVPKNSAWSVATGEWVSRNALSPTTFFPPSLGMNLAHHIIGSTSPYASQHALLLPEPIKQAVDDWAMVVVPKDLRMDAPYPVKGSYIFRTMEPEHASLSQPLYAKDPKFKSRAGDVARDLDGRELAFVVGNRPQPIGLYFQCCCSVWKRERLADPECEDPAEFWARFLRHMSSLWSASYVKKSPVTEVFNPQKEDLSFEKWSQL